MPSLVRKSLRDSRRATICWAAGVAVFVTIYVSFWPVFRDDPELARSQADAFPEGVAEALGQTDYTSAAGYLQGTVYALFVPLLLIMCAAVLGSRTIAGPEESGMLDVLLANPIGRRRFVVERFAAAALAVLTVGLTAWLMVLAFAAGFDMGISIANLTAATLALVLTALLFGSLAVATGAVFGRRAVVLAVTGAAAVGSYVIEALGTQVEAVRTLRWISPFHYYGGGDSLRVGFQTGYLLVLAGVTAALVAAAAVAFERRDVGV